MRSIRTEENAVTIWLSGEPVPGREEILSLVKRSLAEKGFVSWADTEAECFAAGEETLVIARPGTVRRRAFFFDGLEELLAGVTLVRDGEGALYAVNGGYILTVRSEERCDSLREYGRELRLHPLWEDYAREREWCLIPAYAPAALKEGFRQD